MKTAQIILVVFFLFNEMSPVHAQDTDYHAVKDISQLQKKIQDTSKEIQTIRASFEQLKHLSILENDIKSYGMFYFKRENNLRWAYEKPYQYVIVMTGDEIRIKNEQKINAFDLKSNRLFREISLLMSVLLRGEIFDNQAFSIEMKENENYYLAMLQPTTEELKQFLDIVYLYFDKEQLTVAKLRMIEKSGDYTLITFNEKEINIEIQDSIFDLH